MAKTARKSFTRIPIARAERQSSRKKVDATPHTGTKLRLLGTAIV